MNRVRNYCTKCVCYDVDVLCCCRPGIWNGFEFAKLFFGRPTVLEFPEYFVAIFISWCIMIAAAKEPTPAADPRGEVAPWRHAEVSPREGVCTGAE